jgi:hypothetical protein
MVTTRKPKALDAIDLLDRDESWALIEENAQRELGMTARQFIEAWDAGTIPELDRPGVMRMAALLSFVR